MLLFYSIGIALLNLYNKQAKKDATIQVVINSLITYRFNHVF